MKIRILFAFCALLLSGTIKAQDSKEKLTFTYQQLPLYPLSEDRTYSVEVVLPYEAEVLAERAKIEAENEKLKEEAKKEKAEYEKKSVGEKLARKVLLDEKKPDGNAELIETPFFQTIWNHDEIKSKVSIPGMEQSADAAAKIKVIINRFDWTYKEEYIKDKGHYYRVNATGTITMEAYNDKGERINSKNFAISQVGKGNDFQSKYFRSSYDRDKDWNLNKESKLRSIEASKLEINSRSMMAYLSQNMGYNAIEYKSVIFTFKSKKQDYTALNAAFPIAAEAYNMLATYPIEQVTIGKIDEMIAIWESEIKNIDANNKKAKINANVGEALYLNLAQACIWKEDFSQAAVYLAKYKVLDPKGRNSTYKDIQNLYDDQKARYQANH
ncbi:MAG: hypothetical protein ACPGLV_14315 [Bacteroidia bacterium]